MNIPISSPECLKSSSKVPDQLLSSLFSNMKLKLWPVQMEKVAVTSEHAAECAKLLPALVRGFRT